jgi:hypothetical protein
MVSTTPTSSPTMLDEKRPTLPKPDCHAVQRPVGVFAIRDLQRLDQSDEITPLFAPQIEQLPLSR